MASEEMCCAAFVSASQRQIEQDDDGTWSVHGCCGGGCYVLTGVKFCPFCGAALSKLEAPGHE